MNTDLKYFFFLLGCAAAALLIGLATGYGMARIDTQREWIAWSCAQHNAVIANDTLCVRADTSFRIPSPYTK